ncbi:MAG: hypothetical protein ACON31_07880 [Candidatus Puniceispirillaceae bacterium]
MNVKCSPIPVVAIAMLAAAFVCSPASADNKSGIGLGFVQMQKLWNGLVEKPRMTTCRLATRQTVKKKQICVYSGANRTYVAIYNDAGAYCAGEMRCKYDPDTSKTTSDYVIAFRNAQKKK